MSKALQLAEIYKEVEEQFHPFEISEDNKVKIAVSLFIDSNSRDKNGNLYTADSMAAKGPTQTAGQAASPQGDGDTRTVSGLLSGKTKQDLISKAGKPYSKFVYTVGGVQYNTLDKKVAAALSGAIVNKDQVTLQLQKKGNFENVINGLVSTGVSEDEEESDEIPF